MSTYAPAVIHITAAPAHGASDEGAFAHPAGFQVLEWTAGGPVVALHGERVTLSAADGWSWSQTPATH